MSARGTAHEPREFFGSNSEDGQVSGGQGAAHGAKLNAMAKTIHEARTAERFHVMKDDGDASTGGFQDLQNAREFAGETARGPGKGRVLNENPAPAPRCRLEAQCVEGVAPTENLPGNSANTQSKIMGLQSGAEVAAILLDGVCGHVSASEKSDDGRIHLGRAST